MDKVAEFLTVVRNAGVARLEKVDVPSSKFRIGLAEILANHGFIRSYKVAKDSKQGIMRMYLKYDESGKHAMTSLEKVSKPGRRVYVKSHEVPKVRSGLGIAILSTSKGVKSGKQAAELGLGGELICTVW